MKSDDIFDSVLNSLEKRGKEDVDFLLLIAVLHLHSLVIDGSVVFDDLPDDGKPTRFAPITRRHSAECVARLFEPGTYKADPLYWWNEYNVKLAAEDVSEIPDGLKDKFGAITKEILSNPKVRELVPLE
jgi:hypothetical protein